jgi:hypothetical protein
MDSLSNNVVSKRAMLLATGTRFSPQVQKVKETAVDRIVTQILYAATEGEGLSFAKIEEVFREASGGYSINSSDLKDALDRIAVSSLELLAVDLGSKKVYKLTDDIKKKMVILQGDAERGFNRVMVDLFSNAPLSTEHFLEPFLYGLSSIFSQLGEEIVRLLKNEFGATGHPAIETALEAIQAEYSDVDLDILKTALIRFFQSDDPDYNEIKWNMAQSYYLTKVLGLDPEGTLLSEEVFERSIFYLDTNILIAALEPVHEMHTSFVALSNVTNQLDINLRVCLLSLDEMQTWLASQRRVFEKVVDQIPEALAPKVADLFYEKYLIQKKDDASDFDIDEFFANFDDPRKSLKENYAVEYEDEEWFDTARDKPDVQKLAKKIKSKSKAHRQKRDETAMHDALLMKWVQEQRKRTKRRTWLVTLDASLSRPTYAKTEDSEAAITLAGVLQWISPIANLTGNQDFTKAFSEMVRSRILPQNRFLKMEDFLVFADMEMTCKNLPPEDVEGCIMYIKAKAPQLNLSKPSDREELYHNVSKFFADPTRKFHKELDRYRDMLGKAKDEVLESKQLAAEEKTELQIALGEHKSEIEQLRGQIDAQKQRDLETNIRGLARKKYHRVVGLFFSLELIVIALASQYAEGQNIFEKIIAFWQFILICVPIVAFVTLFYLEKQELLLLGWPYDKLLGFSEKSNKKDAS